MTDDELRKFGGPAFPESCGAEGYRANVYPGMTLRDYFAAKALASIIVGDGAQYFAKHESHAAWAYAQADAMLAVRQP